jgi:N-acetylneuraminate synthase/sialic acid synthase
VRQLILGDRVVTQASDAYVVAEIGCNHMGVLDNAFRLYWAAEHAGVDAVKLQKRNSQLLFTDLAYGSPYASDNSFACTYGKHREMLELSEADWQRLFMQATAIPMFATPFEASSVDFLEQFNPPFYKTSSADIVDLDLLKYIARLGKTMLISTGGASISDVAAAYDTVCAFLPDDRICLMQCTSAYPARPEDMNLRVIETYMREFPNTIIGLSSHYNGISLDVAAYVLGARVIEKHFTLDRTWKGTDQSFSLEPNGMKKLVSYLRNTRVALGDGEKHLRSVEESAMKKLRKSAKHGWRIPHESEYTKESSLVG